MANLKAKYSNVPCANDGPSLNETFFNTHLRRLRNLRTDYQYSLNRLDGIVRRLGYNGVLHEQTVGNIEKEDNGYIREAESICAEIAEANERICECLNTLERLA